MWSHPLSFNLIQPPSASAPSNNSELPMNCTTIVIDQRVTRHVSIRLSRICTRLYIREHNTRRYRISARVCCVWPYLNREWLSSTTYVYSFAFIRVYSQRFETRANCTISAFLSLPLSFVDSHRSIAPSICLYLAEKFSYSDWLTNIDNVNHSEYIYIYFFFYGYRYSDTEVSRLPIETCRV